jgi:hypothetical protein
MLIALIGGTAIIYLGGILLGSNPDYIRLPGPYLPSADFRTQDAETLAAVGWAGRHLPGATVAATEFRRYLGVALWPVTNPSKASASAIVLLNCGPQQTAIVKGAY